MISDITRQTTPLDTFSVNKKNKTDEASPGFSILSDEVGFMLERMEKSDSQAG